MTAALSFERRLVGAQLHSLLQQQYFFEGELSSDAGVIFGQLGPDSWVRFFFDGGIFFWREVASPELPASDCQYRWSLHQLSIGKRVPTPQIANVYMTCSEDQSVGDLIIGLTTGVRIGLHNENDFTTLVISGA
jgi:hypothetical protein